VRRMRNPKWERDELILALDLYFRHNPAHISSSHPEVVRLSEILNRLPLHEKKPDAEHFRNPNGVYMKLCNFLRFDPTYKGKGLERGGKFEQQIWDEFAGDNAHLRKVAQGIISSIGRPYIRRDEVSVRDEEEEAFPEGKVLYRQHVYRERNRRLVEAAKQLASKKGNLKCQICAFNFHEKYGELGKGYIECHHTLPVSEYSEKKKTKVGDLALVCSNCHRMLHRKRPWLTTKELSQLLDEPK
jgi:5-methylcytosine-specific restriction enzyme A